MGVLSPAREKQRTQNVLRIFLDPLLDALGKLGTNAYMPLLRTDRCLQLLVKLLHSCVPRGSSGQDGEDDRALGCLAGGVAGVETERKLLMSYARISSSHAYTEQLAPSVAGNAVGCPSDNLGGLFTIIRMWFYLFFMSVRRVHVCTPVCVSVFMWRPEVDIGCSLYCCQSYSLSQSLFTEPRAVSAGRAGQPLGSSCLRPISTFPHAGLTDKNPYTRF